jgi:MFS family permease
MVVDTLASDADLGMYTGLYYIASQLAAVAGPTINGYIAEWGGGDYNLIFVVTPAFFVLAILSMLGVTKGGGEGELERVVRTAVDRSRHGLGSARASHPGEPAGSGGQWAIRSVKPATQD